MNIDCNLPTDLVDSYEAAEIVKCKPVTLANWRCKNKNDLPFYKIRGRVFYSRHEVLKWVMNQVSQFQDSKTKKSKSKTR